MNAIIILLNAIFAKLTTAVNKAFEKSHRGQLTLDISQTGIGMGDVAELTDLFPTSFWVRGSGQYRVEITAQNNPQFNVFLVDGTELGRGTFFNVTVDSGYIIAYSVEKLSEQAETYIRDTATQAATTKANAAQQNAITEAANLADAARLAAIDSAYTTSQDFANNAEQNAALDATAKADAAKNEAITEAGLLAVAAKNQAITAAASDATDKALAARVAAIGIASADATTKADAAKADAVQTAAQYATDARLMATETANLYTDAEIAKLQQYASIGIKSFKTFEGLVTTIGANSTIANLPSYVAFGIPTTETGAHIINVTGVNADGSIVDDKEFTLTVPTGVDAQGVATTTNIVVSTNDKLIVELYKLADGSFFMKYLQKYDDRLMEVVKQLMVKIETQVSESELLSAVTDVKTYVDAQINAALV